MSQQSNEIVQIQPQEWTLAGSHPHNYEFDTMANARAESPASAYVQAKQRTSWRVTLGSREDWASMRFMERIQNALILIYYSLSSGFGTLIRSFPAENYRGERLRMTRMSKRKAFGNGLGCGCVLTVLTIAL